MSKPAFDVFLCHNSRDKPAVERIARELIERGLKPWLDIWQLRPGLPWQREAEAQIETVGAAAVFVGNEGRGPWQDLEIEALLFEFVKRSCPVIPVILPDCEDVPKLPVFLRSMTWVDFREERPNPMDRLVWGITDERPEPNYSDDATRELSLSLDGDSPWTQGVRDADAEGKTDKAPRSIRERVKRVLASQDDEEVEDESRQLLSDGWLPEAQQVAERLIELAEDRSQEREAQANELLGDVLAEKGEGLAARVYWQTARDKYRKLGAPAAVADLDRRLSNAQSRSSHSDRPQS